MKDFGRLFYGDGLVNLIPDSELESREPLFGDRDCPTVRTQEGGPGRRIDELKRTRSLIEGEESHELSAGGRVGAGVDLLIAESDEAESDE